MNYVLIAPLGLTPGVVTATVQALQDDDTPLTDTSQPVIERVYTLSTYGEEAEIASDIVGLFLRDHTEPPVQHRPHFLPEGQSDVRGKDDADAFQKLLDKTLREAERWRDADPHTERGIIVSVAGGRKTMSALVAVTAQRYRIDHLIDLWVDSDVEALSQDTRSVRSRLQDMKHALEQNNLAAVKKSLCPHESKRRLVPLPLLPLANIQDEADRIGTLELRHYDDPLPVTVNIPKKRLQHLFETTAGRLTVPQAEDLCDIEADLTHRPNKSRRLFRFLKDTFKISQFGSRPADNKPYAWAQFDFEAPVDDDAFGTVFIASLQRHFTDKNIFYPDFPGTWDNYKRSIKGRYPNGGNYAQYTVSLLRHGLNTGFDFEVLNAHEAQQAPKHIFLSYAHAADDIARKIHRHLRMIGFDVWWDKDIVPGSIWHMDIWGAMSRASGSLIIVTEDIFTSSYIKEQEIPMLHQNLKKRFMIPLVMDDSLDKTVSNNEIQSIQQMLKVPQYIDFREDAQTYEEAMQELRQSLLKHGSKSGT